MIDLKDNDNLRNYLRIVLPGLSIDGVAAASGQRVVYFASFVKQDEIVDVRLLEYPQVVVKVSGDIDNNAIAYLQKEINTLRSLDAAEFPEILFDELFPVTPLESSKYGLPSRIFVTIEEKIDAEPLTAYMGKPVSELFVTKMLLSACEALVHLWNAKPALVHRDLKPANILVNAEEKAFIIDFGLLREVGSAGITASHAPFGPCTPMYASPEQATNDKLTISFRSDVFSLGIIGYELLTGNHPFFHPDRTGISEVLSAIVEDEPTDLSNFSVKNQRLENLVSKMLAKEPYKRPRTPDILLSELKAIKVEIDHE